MSGRRTPFLALLASCVLLPACGREVPSDPGQPSADQTGIPQVVEAGGAGLDLKIGQSTHIGGFRENNEDATNVKPMPTLTVCLVADGMGGKAAGEIASKRAVEVIPRQLAEQLKAGASVEDAKRIILGRGNAEEAADLVVAHLPPNCGPAVPGTVEDLER